MTETGSEIYVIQTLFDGQWRTDKKFISQDQAQKYANLLVPDWGKARVRLLVGQYDAENGRRRYHEASLCAPLNWHQSLTRRLGAGLARGTNPEARSRSGPLLGIALVLFTLIAVGGGTSFASRLQEEGDNQRSSKAPEQVASAGSVAAIGPNSREVFADMAARKGYGKLEILKEVPVRLQGDWGTHCAAGQQAWQIAGKRLTEYDGAVPNDIPLQAVFQSGQTYGLVHENGSVTVLEMTSFDSLKPVAVLTADGKREEPAPQSELSRCM